MKVLQILVLIIGFAFITNAQTTEKAVLSGTVYDVSGAVIPAIKVVFVNQKGERFETTTDEDGGYLYYLPVSKYETVSKDKPETADKKLNKYEITFGNPNLGFKEFVIKDFILSGKMQLDIALDAAANTECEPAGCFSPDLPSTESPKSEISDKILTRPLEELPKEQNKSKRKKKNNK
jgi:hypothetical protein